MYRKVSCGQGDWVPSSILGGAPLAAAPWAHPAHPPLAPPPLTRRRDVAAPEARAASWPQSGGRRPCGWGSACAASTARSTRTHHATRPCPPRPP